MPTSQQQQQQSQPQGMFGRTISVPTSSSLAYQVSSGTAASALSGGTFLSGGGGAGVVVGDSSNNPAVTPEQQPHNGMDHSDFYAWQHMTRTLAHYERTEQIGEGTYGQVYRGVCRDTGRPVALKKMRIQHGSAMGMPLQFIREIKILKRLQHPNLLQMIEVVTSKGVEYLDEDDNEKAYGKSSSGDNNVEGKEDRYADVREGYKGNLYLVLEYVSHDLTGLMDVAYEFTLVQSKCIMRQLLEAIAYMHQQKYVHRDIKSSNILLDSHFRLKLADFGLARCIEPPILDQMHDRASSLQLTNKVITLWYRPPEILVGATSYGGAVDVWSCGCILAELILGKPLFAGKTEVDQLKLITDLLGTPAPDAWEYLSTLKRMRSGEMSIDIQKPRPSKLRDKYESKERMSGVTISLLEKLLEWDPRKRLTASNALQQRFFWTNPVAPADPADLGQIQVGPDGHFHEFQTKKKRKEAKVVAEKAKSDALTKGATENEAKDEFDRVYKGLMKKAAAEGVSGPTAQQPKKIEAKRAPAKTEDVVSAEKDKNGHRERRHSRSREDDKDPKDGEDKKSRRRDGRDTERHHPSRHHRDEEERKKKKHRNDDHGDGRKRRRDKEGSKERKRKSTSKRHRSESKDKGGDARRPDRADDDERRARDKRTDRSLSRERGSKSAVDVRGHRAKEPLSTDSRSAQGEDRKKGRDDRVDREYVESAGSRHDRSGRSRDYNAKGSRHRDRDRGADREREPDDRGGGGRGFGDRSWRAGEGGSRGGSYDGRGGHTDDKRNRDRNRADDRFRRDDDWHSYGGGRGGGSGSGGPPEYGYYGRPRDGGGGAPHGRGDGGVPPHRDVTGGERGAPQFHDRSRRKNDRGPRR